MACCPKEVAKASMADLRLYALGDGGQLAGVEVAARLADDRGLFLVLLLD
jgi:hypothetical protein